MCRGDCLGNVCLTARGRDGPDGCIGVTEAALIELQREEKMKSKYWSVLVFAAIIAFFSVRRMKMAEVSTAEAVVLWVSSGYCSRL